MSNTRTPTLTEAAQAADLLGVTSYVLGFHLRKAAADAFAFGASEVRRGHPADLGQARRLLRAAEVCEAADEEENNKASAA